MFEKYFPVAHYLEKCVKTEICIIKEQIVHVAQIVQIVQTCKYKVKLFCTPSQIYCRNFFY